MMLLMVPVLAPTLMQLGIDPIWFGIFFTIMIECALITPPVGLNLFVIQSIGRARIEDVIAGSWVFVALMLATIVCIYFAPWIALALTRL
jgi:C4-dicarboxylate transporter DctM subunit